MFFAYSKAGFPMLRQTKKIRDIIEKRSFDDLKQLDIATIACNILEVPIPFSSLGIFHPLFHMSENMVELPQRMLANIIQLNTYIDEYCAASPSLSWCEEQLADFHA